MGKGREVFFQPALDTGLWRQQEVITKMRDRRKQKKSFPHITPKFFIGFNMEGKRFAEKHHLKVIAKNQNPAHTYIWHCMYIQHK